MRNISAFLICTLAACTPVAVTEIEWKDGDSGIIDGVEFRLKDVDAPETSPVGDRPGQAKCELERRRGFAAADYMRAFTRSEEVTIPRQYGTDRYGRIEVDLAVGGRDVADVGLEAGHLKSWKHLNGRPLEDRPDWCSE